ncbi:hypothetical protein KQI63_15455 [bacterium]|nr:hypothetical protein [bacterium]
MDTYDRSMRHLSNRLQAPERAYMTSNIFSKLLSTLSIVLAALIAPLAWLTRKPVVPAFLGTAIVIIEGIQLVFRFNDDLALRRLAREKARLRAMRDTSPPSV